MSCVFGGAVEGGGEEWEGEGGDERGVSRGGGGAGGRDLATVGRREQRGEIQIVGETEGRRYKGEYNPKSD